MKKTKLLKPILASLIIESLLIAPLAAAENSCKLSQSTIEVLSRLNDQTRPVMQAVTGLDSRLRDVKAMEGFKNRIKEIDLIKDKVTNAVNSLNSVDLKDKARNKKYVEETTKQKNNVTEPLSSFEFSTKSIQINSVTLQDGNLNLQTEVYVQPNDEEFSPVSTDGQQGTAMVASWHDSSIQTITNAAKKGEKEVLSQYFQTKKYNKLDYILKNTNDFKGFGKCLQDPDYQKTDKCDDFIDKENSRDPEKREKYFHALKLESEEYFEKYKVTDIKKLNADEKNPSYSAYLKNQYEEPVLEKAAVKGPEKSSSKIDSNSVKPEVVQAIASNKVSSSSLIGTIPLLNKWAPSAQNKNAEETTRNINSIAQFLIDQNISNKRNDLITPTMKENPSLIEEKYYEYHTTLGELSNLELLFSSQIDGISNMEETPLQFKNRLVNQIELDRESAKRYDAECLDSYKQSSENPKKIPDDKREICAKLSDQIITTLNDYKTKIQEGLKYVSYSIEENLTDEFYAAETLKLAVAKESYQDCLKQNPSFSTTPENLIYPCAQARGGGQFELSTIANLGNNSIVIAKKITKENLTSKNTDKENREILDSCAILTSKLQKNSNSISSSPIQEYCQRKSQEINTQKEISAKNKQRFEEARSQEDKNYHLSMSTNGSNSIIKTPKQSFAEGFVRALVNNLATAAPGYMNYFQQGVMIDTMRSDGFLKKQALHNYKFYQNNIMAGQLPWYNSLSSFGYTVNSNLSYPINSTTVGTSLTGTGIGTGNFSF